MEDWESKDNIQEAILRTEDQRQMYEFGKEASMILFIITMIFSFIFSHLIHNGIFKVYI